MIYFARKQDCHACALKPQCCPNVPARKIARSVHEAARDKARAIAKTEAYAVSCRERKKVEMLFSAHLKRILRLGRLRLRGPNGAKDEFLFGRHRAKSQETGEADPAPGPDLCHISRRARIPPSDCRRNRYPLSSAEGFFNTIRRHRTIAGQSSLVRSPLASTPDSKLTLPKGIVRAMESKAAWLMAMRIIKTARRSG